MAAIRSATEADLDQLVAMSKLMHDESPRYQGMGFNPAKLRRTLSDALHGTVLRKPDCVLVAEAAGQIVGMAYGLETEHRFTDACYFQEMGVYVSPAQRGSTAFHRLVQAMEEWAARRGITEMVVGCSTGIHAEQTIRMYERLGYAAIGCSLVKTL